MPAPSGRTAPAPAPPTAARRSTRCHCSACACPSPSAAAPSALSACPPTSRMRTGIGTRGLSRRRWTTSARRRSCRWRASSRSPSTTTSPTSRRPSTMRKWRWTGGWSTGKGG